MCRTCHDTDILRPFLALFRCIVRYTSVCRYEYGREDRVVRLYVNRCRGRYKGVTNGSSDAGSIRSLKDQ